MLSLIGSLAVADRRPRRLIGKEVPAQSIGAVAVEDLLRLAIVAFALGHLLRRLRPASAPARCSFERMRKRPRLNRFVRDTRLVRRIFAEQQRADRQQAVEPAACLVERLADEVGGELVAELLAAPECG